MTSASSYFVQDAASVAATRFQEAVSHMQKPETRSQIQARVDYVVKKMFAPCVGEIGGVPFDDCGGDEGSGNIRSDAVPMEVSPNSTEENMNPPVAAAATQPQQFTFGKAFPETKNNTKRQENSLQKLKKLGARHQLASGYIDPTLPDAARPVSPDETCVTPSSMDDADEPVEDEVDFDDGISAISSHTLEEMEKRRQLHTVTVSPTEFSKPRLPPSSKINNTDFSKKPMMETISDGAAEEDNFFGESFFNQTAPQLGRFASNASNDSHQLEKAWDVDEVNYWKDEVKKDKKKDKRSSRRQQRLSVEERAKRLRELSNRELSRSRSRSSGTHPHDTSGLIEQIRQV
mmetsp:Transcript_11650/g.17831  ORF Transcript_11650/g.17831 Transcript_11650/m.17831 type:complete len:346 (+) Transcript_11650:87-1124(+)